MRWIPILPTLLIVAFVMACGGGKKAPEATATPAATATPDTSAPDTSLAVYVQTTLNKTYVGDCAQAGAQADATKLCSIFKGERNGMRAYLLGQSATQGTQWAILGQQNGKWSVVYSQKITPDNASVPGIPWPLTVGAIVVVTGTGNCLNVREGPGLDQTAVDCIKDGATITLAAGPTDSADYQWWQVEGRTGWVVADFLRYPDAASDAAPPAPTAAPAAPAPTQAP
jgi:hypothetical protein